MEIIKVENFSKNFGKKTVHSNVSFSVKSGECLGLIGGSGAGKSVLLRSLIGLETPDAGAIYIESKNIVGLKEQELFEVRKKVAYVFQYGALFDSMTVFENLAYPLIEHSHFSMDRIRDEVSQLLERFNLAGTENMMPGELSGGMQKRVGLARAIILSPMAVLYDEPTAGLDPANTETIQDLMLNLKGTGSTSILVTHDMDTALKVCDRICFLKNGHLMELESVEILRSHRNRILELFLKDEP